MKTPQRIARVHGAPPQPVAHPESGTASPPPARQVIAKDVLRRLIASRLRAAMPSLIGLPYLVIERQEPDGPDPNGGPNSGPNWRLSFRIRDTPTFYARTWDRIRGPFEATFDITDD